MAWVKLDDQARHHRKLLKVGPAAAWLWVCGLMYCNSQKARDGFIPATAVPILYPMRSDDRGRYVAKLVNAGLWEDVDGGYFVHDYHEYQPTFEAAVEAREAKSVAGRLGGLKSGEARRSATIASDGPPSSRPAPLTAPPSNRPNVPQAAPPPSPPPTPSRSLEVSRPSKLVSVGTAGMEEALSVYVDAITEATGRTVAMPNERTVRAHLALAVNTHLASSGTIRGALADLRVAVAEWVEAYREKPQLTAGWTPKKFLDWLNSERVTDAGAQEKHRAPVKDYGPPVACPPGLAEKLGQVDAIQPFALRGAP